jgi:hypothetical protein
MTEHREAASPGTSAEGPEPQQDHAAEPRGCLRTLATIALVGAGLAVLAFVGLVIILQQSFKPAQAVPAPVAWTSHEAVLSADVPEIHGRLTLATTAAPATTLRVGVNAGVPSSDVHEPGAVLSGPVVLLTATASSATRSCVAPCELEMSSTFACSSGRCQITIDITLELVGDGAGLGGGVTVGVAGGTTGKLDSRLPEGLTVDVTLDDTPTPSGS